MPINRIYADGHTLYRVMRQPVIYKKINVWSQPDLRSSDATRCIHNLHLPPENFKWLILIKIEKCRPAGMGRMHRRCGTGGSLERRLFSAILYYSLSGKRIMEGTGETDSQQNPLCPDPPEKKACNKSFKGIKYLELKAPVTRLGPGTLTQKACKYDDE